MGRGAAPRRGWIYGPASQPCPDAQGVIERRRTIGNRSVRNVAVLEKEQAAPPGGPVSHVGNGTWAAGRLVTARGDFIHRPAASKRRQMIAERDRRIAALHREGQTQAEIGEELDVPRETVRNVIDRIGRNRSDAKKAKAEKRDPLPVARQPEVAAHKKRPPLGAASKGGKLA